MFGLVYLLILCIFHHGDFSLFLYVSVCVYVYIYLCVCVCVPVVVRDAPSVLMYKFVSLCVCEERAGQTDRQASLC